MGHPSGGSVARYALQKDILGARLVKEITLRDGHPFVYQRHIFEGGEGAISVASHAMTKFATRGKLSFSPKAYGEAPPNPQESDPARGRSALAYPSHFEDLTKVPLKDGGTTSIRSYPIASRHEDFVMLVEAKGRSFGWAAAVREDAGDIVLSLKKPEVTSRSPSSGSAMAGATILHGMAGTSECSGSRKAEPGRRTATRPPLRRIRSRNRACRPRFS